MPAAVVLEFLPRLVEKALQVRYGGRWELNIERPVGKSQMQGD